MTPAERLDFHKELFAILERVGPEEFWNAAAEIPHWKGFYAETGAEEDANWDFERAITNIETTSRSIPNEKARHNLQWPVRGVARFREHPGDRAGRGDSGGVAHVTALRHEGEMTLTTPLARAEITPLSVSAGLRDIGFCTRYALPAEQGLTSLRERKTFMEHENEVEEWRPVVGREGIYEISSLGNLRSVDRMSIRKRGNRVFKYPIKGRLLRPFVNRHGYLMGGLVKPNSKAVHKIVIEAFVGPCPDGLQTRHLDGNRRNNRASNLCYGTAKENAKDKRDHGTIGVGEKSPNVRLNDEKVRWILDNAGSISDAKMARMLQVSEATIRIVRIGQTWKHISRDSPKS